MVMDVFFECMFCCMGCFGICIGELRKIGSVYVVVVSWDVDDWLFVDMKVIVGILGWFLVMLFEMWIVVVV